MSLDVFVIGYGNTLRGDDAVGQELASRFCQLLEQRNLKFVCILATQLLPEHALELAESGAQGVVFFDAALNVSNEQRRGLEVRDLSDYQTAQESAPFLGHLSSPQQILNYGAQCGYSPRFAILVTAPVFEIGLGEGLSLELRSIIENSQLLEQVAEQVTASVRQIA